MGMPAGGVRAPSVKQRASTISGFFDAFDEGVARGWVVDRAAPLAQLRVHVIIDGQEVAQLIADGHRADVRESLQHPTGDVGFTYEVPFHYYDGADHHLSFRLAGDLVVPWLAAGDTSKHGDMVFRLKPKVTINGHVDGLRQGQLFGWVTRTVHDGSVAGGACHVLVTCDGAYVAQLRADRYRGDVAAATGCDPNCGFQMTVPRAFRSATPRTFRFQAMPEGVDIGGSPITTSTVIDQLEAALLDVSGRMEAMFRDFVKLRRSITDLVPQPGYNLSDYNRWATAYYPALRARVMAERATRAEAGIVPPDPLVSILVPAYRPMMSDFTAAVESAIAQTYENWELVIVDDCSNDAELTKTIDAYCARDSRIRSIVRKKNGNISEATNTAIKEARGEWVAFFDHDDLLVDVAIEMMVRAAQRTGARILYSDEDKVDMAGYYLEPNFKPDWNYRYMLGCNYVCHLLFVERAALEEVGPLRTQYNGAQDHDLILRLSEIVPAERIHHVPEMLYHWRKTPNSTAADLSTKSYAKDAGVKAVGDHLARRGLPAKVENVRGLTLYNPVWRFTASPRICIIIPFKDQIETTRKCLQTVLEQTVYKQFEVIMIDNWSMTEEAELFVADAVRDPRVRVLRVEEPFNFSRLNNLAAAQTKAKFLLFMNNDLFPTDPNWLRLLVNEALVDEQVAAVGGRFIYPNDTIQHAGVVVGPRGMAAHVHRGAPTTDYGYIGRIALAHEVTAVTAACMLVRASVFKAVGGFDETGFKVAFNDVDLCLRIRAAGHRIVYCAEMIAIHHESLSRGSDERPEQEARFFQEQQALLDRWGDHPLFLNDPAYSPHMTVDLQTFYDLVPPT